MFTWTCSLMPPCTADFLRLSRSTVDDSITQNLNALVTPARAGFDPSSTSHRNPAPTATSRQLSPDACASFKDKVLFPSWESRRDVLLYCGSVAASPDPDDPEAGVRRATIRGVGERWAGLRL
jgi:hypothetical protein